MTNTAASIIRRHNVVTLGRGVQPMLFAHGFGCDQNMWRYVTPAFEDSHRIVLFDHVGCGKSDLRAYSKQKYASLAGYAQDILDICGALDLRDVIFVGHSVSAMMGVLAATADPSVFSKLVLIGPSPCYVNKNGYVGGFEQKDLEQLLDFMDDNFLGWAGAIAPKIMGNSERAELAEELTNSFCRTDPEIAKHFARVTFMSDNRDDLGKVKTPCLVLQCSNDIIAPEQVGDYVHRHLPSSRLMQMKATGHCPNLSAPEETIDAIRSFL